MVEKGVLGISVFYRGARKGGNLHVVESVQVPSWVRFSHGLILCLCLLVSRLLPLGLLRGELLCLLVAALVPLVPLRASSVTPLRVPPTCCLGGSLRSTLAVFVVHLSEVMLVTRPLSTLSGCRLHPKVLSTLFGHRLPPKLLSGTKGTPGHPIGPLAKRTPNRAIPSWGAL